MTFQRWAILGSAGMLGQEFINSISSHNLTGFDRAEFDITDIESVRSVLTNFDVVINCVAWTEVDNAETHEEAALKVNGDGPRNVATVCSEIGAQLVQISTDYVFSGVDSVPYEVYSQTDPKTAYGRTKLAGEIAVRQLLPNDSYIVRTAWLYGQYGPNFVKTMLTLEKTRDTLSVVDDQVGQPTWTYDLVQIIEALLGSGAPAGTYHGTSSGQTSWFGFAQEIFRLTGADPNRVFPTTTDNFPRPAPRPSYSVLGHRKWEEVGLEPISDWKIGLAEALKSGGF